MAAELTDQFQLAFDASLELCSLLQRAGFVHESQYGTLAGHRLRWRVAVTAVDMLNVQALAKSDAAYDLARKMRDKLTEVHPILAESMQPELQ